MIETPPLVSVVVPVRDDPGGIRALLERLDAQTLSAERFEVVIGDDGSRPPLSPIGAAYGTRIEAGPRRSSYAARNRAVRAAARCNPRVL